MKYTIPEETPQMLNEDIALTYPSYGIADAIWTLIVNQTADVQEVIAERLNNLRRKSAAKTYTNSRMAAFSKLMLDERPVELDDDVILAECKAAREELYHQSK